MKLAKTSEKLISENYPYGFRLKTTKTDYLEFDKKRGFRHCSFTIDPRNGRVNKPKKSTYHTIIILGKNEENNHTESLHMDFYQARDVDQVIAFFSNQDNFNLFTAEQIEYIYVRFFLSIRTSIQAQVSYCGSKAEDILPFYNEGVGLIVKGIKEKGITNYFSQIKFDWAKIDSFKVEGYQPFKTVSYGV